MDVNIVEGYVLGTAPILRRHVRIALGSAAEAQRLLEIAALRGYVQPAAAAKLLASAESAIRLLYGLLRTRNLPSFR